MQSSMLTSQNIKIVLSSLESLIIEITYEDKNEYNLIREKIHLIKDKMKIYDIKEDNNRIYIIIDRSLDKASKFRQLLLLDVKELKKESVLEGQGEPITKTEISNLLNMEKSMCKIILEKCQDNQIKIGKANGFFCEIEIEDCPIKHALFTSNHILNEDNIKPGNIIKIEYFNKSSYEEKIIKIDETRKVHTNKDYDYTCIEILPSDGIENYFKIDPILFNDKKENLKNSDIFILQYPNGNELSFTYGKIKLLKEDDIIHTASTNEGTSGSPIIRRSKENYVIGLHYDGIKNFEIIDYSFSIGTIFDSILDDIYKPNEIECIYKVKDNEEEIKLLHSYNLINPFGIELLDKFYLKSKELNKKIFEENIDIYVNGEKIKFDFNYKVNENKEIKVKFKFKKRLTNTNYMFMDCSSLYSINLSSFNTNNVTSMMNMFDSCRSLNSVNLSSCNTSRVTIMLGMFIACSSLNSLDLSSFNTNNVINMNAMFFKCSSLSSLNLSSFNTSKVNNMMNIFKDCTNLKKSNVITNDIKLLEALKSINN